MASTSKPQNDVEKILAIPVKDRRNDQHMILIRHYGGVREYLLSMGPFKPCPDCNKDACTCD